MWQISLLRGRRRTAAGQVEIWMMWRLKQVASSRTSTIVVACCLFLAGFTLNGLLGHQTVECASRHRRSDGGDDDGSEVGGQERWPSPPSTVRPLPVCPGPPPGDVDDADRELCHSVLRGENTTDVVSNSTALSAADYIRMTQNCSCFRSDRGYFDADADTTPEERSFPIAFSLLVYENIEQMERLLRLVYRPHNFYCVHVDAKSPPAMHAAVEAIVRCLGDGAFVAKPAISVSWGKMSVLEAELLCIRMLLRLSKRWRYFINLVGRDMPLRTNAELVKILKVYEGANDVDGSRCERTNFQPYWLEFSWSEDDVRGPRKSPPPHGFEIAKGSTHMAATRELLMYAVYDRRARDLLDWMRDIKIPDEHFFPTLNHNPQLNISGSYLGDPDGKIYKRSMARAKHWSFVYRHTCAGEWVRWVCNIGVGDLPWVVQSREMFVNKIRLEREPNAFRCLELWYRDRVRPPPPSDVSNRTSATLATVGVAFDLRFYATQDFVKNHHPPFRDSTYQTHLRYYFLRAALFAAAAVACCFAQH